MLKPRVIPCLLLKKQGLVKTVKFKEPRYIGDPINTVKIFNEKEVDELFFLNISATNEKKRPPFKLIAKIASECFMPLGYGGGIRSVDDIRTILSLGVEKVSINSYAVEKPKFIKEAADIYGSQSIIVSIDVKKNFWGRYEVITHSGRKSSRLDPVKHALDMEQMGAGEILLNSIDRDGTMVGYDLDLLGRVTQAVTIPVISCGGAGSIEDFTKAIEKGGASAAAAGSIFVFQGKHRAVLINVPSMAELQNSFNKLSC